MDYTERVLRQRIAAIPDGEYRAEGFLDDDGKNRDVRLPIKVCVRVKGDGIEIDLTGSSNQVETAFNVPFEGSTKVACFCAIRSLLLDAVTSDVKVPSNQGSFRPVNVIAPKGSIYNPKFTRPRPRRGFAQINRVIDLIYKALAPVLPDDIIAGSSASLSFCSYAGIRPTGDYWVFLEVNEGSYGGRPRSDGPDCIDSLMANTRNNPIEDLAMHLPMICDRYELRDDVLPGAGRFRGGIGVVKAQRVLTDAFITHENERHHDVPWGIFGGDPGQVGQGRHLQRRPARRRQAHAGEVLRPARGGGRRACVLRPLRWRLWRPAGAAGGKGPRRRAGRLLHDRTCPRSPTVSSSIASPRLSTKPRPGHCASACGRPARCRPPIQTPAPRARATPAVPPPMQPSGNGSRPREQTIASALSPPPLATTNGHDRVLVAALRRLRDSYGNAWSFEIVRHSAIGRYDRGRRPTARQWIEPYAKPPSLPHGKAVRSASCWSGPPMTVSASASKRSRATDIKASPAQPIWRKGRRPWNKERQFSWRRWSSSPSSACWRS